MRKGYYYFGECGFINKILSIICFMSFIISGVFFKIGGWEVLTRPGALGNNTYAIWCVFFLLLGIVLMFIKICIHKICSDIATLLTDVEEIKDK